MPVSRTKQKGKRKPDFTVVGTGQLARVLVHALHDAGYRIREIVSRDLPDSKRRAKRLARQVNATARVLSAAEFKASVTWLCIPDDFILQCAHAMVQRKPAWTGQAIVHSSGALSSQELDVFCKSGGVTASAHPLMSFVPNSPSTLKDVPIALEGDAKAIVMLRSILRRLRASVFKIGEGNKPAYHAFGSFASPLLIAYLTQMEIAGALAGLERKLARQRAAAILQQTLTNYLEKGPQEAFSGPLRRGDLGTIRKHLHVLEQNPELKEFYRQLVRIALRELPVKHPSEIEAVVGSGKD